MAISDIVESLGNDAPMGLTEMGKIKIGGLGESRPTSSGGSFRMPRKDDHFTITTLHRNKAGDLVADEQLMKLLIAEYGDKTDGKLRQIPIRVMSDDIDDILQTAFVWYGGKTCGARSDGKTVTWWNDPASGKRLPQPRVETWNPEFLELTGQKNNAKLFKLHSVFNCVIATKESRWGGVYKFRTTSTISFRQLYTSLLQIYQLTGGVMIGMPLVLVVRPIQVAPEGKATTVHVVHCELRGAELALIQEQAMKQASWALAHKQRMLSVQSQYRKLLVAPGNESGSEAADIAQEFQPEQQQIEAAPPRYELLDGDIVDPAQAAQPSASADSPSASPAAGGSISDEEAALDAAAEKPATVKAPPMQRLPKPVENPVEQESHEQPEAPDDAPPQIPQTGAELEAAVAGMCGITADEAKKYLRTALIKPWDQFRTKDQWWARFLAGKVESLVPMRVTHPA